MKLRSLARSSVFAQLSALLLLADPTWAPAPDWENPAVNQRNRMAARATSISFPDEAAALTLKLEESPNYQSLNGQWKFSFAPVPEQAIEGFHAAVDASE